MNLKEQAINGVLWNTFGTLASFAVEFVIGIVLARILTPAEFGLVGTIMVVIAISQVFVNSGFSQAIVRKQDCTQEDYSTVFFFNLVAGIVLYLILFASAGPISRFFNNPELRPLIQVLGIVLIIGSFTLIQQAILIKMIDFKLQTRVAIIASVLSGVIAILMAITGYGVWSLIAKALINQGIISFLLWYYNRWRPDLIFNAKSFRELFGFGSKLMLSGLVGTFFNNIYYGAIGKYFSAPDLGFYTRAELFKNIPSQTAERVITAVGYPVLARVQDDPQKLNSAFRQILTTTFYIVAVFMFGMAAVADSMVVTLIGEQWRQSVVFLQMLCFVGLLYPLNSININLLNVVGRSDLYLKLQVISQVLTVPVIVFGILFGIQIMIFGMCLNSLLAFFYFSRVSSKFSGYSVGSQLKDILPLLLVTALMGALVYLADYISGFRPFVTLIIQIMVGTLFMLFAGESLGLKEHKFIKSILLDNFRRFTNK
jgi:O-antigen/teichoic acid export membrane protein